MRETKKSPFKVHRIKRIRNIMKYQLYRNKELIFEGAVQYSELIFHILGCGTVLIDNNPYFRVHTHRFSLLLNSLINFKDMVDFEVLLRLGLRFYRYKSLILLCSP